MGRHKQGDPFKDMRCIKKGLASIIRPRYRRILIAIISELSIRATKIANLASLLLLMMVNFEHILLCFFLLHKHIYMNDNTILFFDVGKRSCG